MCACARRVALSIVVLASTLIPVTVLAQTSGLPPDDTNTPAAQQYASQSKESDGGSQFDDPAARAEWLGHLFSGYDPAARDNYLQAITQQQQQYPNLAAQPPSPTVVNDTSSVSFGGATFSASTGGPRWISIGPTRADFATNGSFGLAGAIDSGRARAILPHPTDPETVYFLTSGGGLWKTTNFHSNPPNWIPLSDSLPTTSGGSAAFGSTPTTLYLGLGDPYDQTLPGGMIVKSTDGGASWSGPITLGSSLSVRDVKVDTSTGQDIVLVATDSGVWRSGDGGLTYQQVIGAGSNLAGWSIVQTSAGWLASVQPCAASLVVKEACGTSTTLYFSTDLGQTWNPISNAGNVFFNVSRTTLAVGNAGDAIVYALSGNLAENATANVFRSTDGGQTWVALGVNSTRAPTNPNSDQPDLDVLHGQSWYNQMILVDPTNSNIVYIGGNLSSLKTSDAGATWSVTSNWLYSHFPGVPYAHADFHAAAISTLGGKNTVFFGNDGGLFISTDGGATFDSSRNENLTTHLFYSIAATPSYPNVVYGGLQDNGTRVQESGTTTFNGVLGGDGVGAGWSQANSNVSVGGANGGARFNITNQPPNTIWDWLSLGFPTDNFLLPVTFPRATADPTGNIVFVASASLIRKVTINNGFFVSTVYNRTNAGTGAPTVRSSPHNVGISPFDMNRIAFGGAGGILGITTTSGGSNGGAWSFFNLISLFPPGGANGAGFQGFNYNVVWQDNNNLLVSAAAQIPGSIHVLKGTLSGTTWNFVRSDSGLPAVSVQKIVFDPTDPTNNTAYAATDIGVYRSLDGGNTWTQYGAGLPAVRVSDIYVAPNGSYIKIATYGRGLWELPGLEFRSASLVDDGTAADDDGILDNGESGHLLVTVNNNSGGTLSQVTAGVSANSPAVTFPGGNTITFPSIAPGADSTASVAVALNNASTNQQVDFTIAYGDPALNLPSAVAATKSIHVNFKEGFGTFDDVEAPDTAWTVTGATPSAPDVFNWERREIAPSQHRWAITDSNVVTDNSLVSPTMHVGSGPFTFSFSHRFLFESATISGVVHFFDGGVIEISTDGGFTWNDIGSSATPTYNATLDPGLNPLGGRKAYGGNSGIATFTPVNVNLGTAYANQDVKIRFRVGTDESTGSEGWELDNFVFNGITNNPFIVNVANAPKDVTGQINIVQSGYAYNPATRRFSQTITLTNNTGSDVLGPVSYVLDNLSSNATVVSPTGTTASNPPLGSPYVNVNIGSSGVFSSGASATVVIQFNDPTRTAITYTPRVLAGSGPR